jgi:hypothetical protein
LSETDWPALPPGFAATTEAQKLLYQAKLERVKADRELLAQRQDAAQRVEDDLRSAVHTAYLEVAKQSIERSISRAQFVTTVAGTIVSLYTALLGLVYSLSTKPLRPLPGRGLAPAVFLGLSLVFSAAYVAFLRRHTMRYRPLPAGIGGDVDEQRLISFIAWASASIQQRSWALRIGVICLGLGVALLPLPFVVLASWETALVVAGAALIVIAWVCFAELPLGKRVRSAIGRRIAPTI